MTAATALWTTEELPGLAFDPEPDDDEDDGEPWCWHPDLHGQGLTPERLGTMTTITPNRSYL